MKNINSIFEINLKTLLRSKTDICHFSRRKLDFRGFYQQVSSVWREQMREQIHEAQTQNHQLSVDKDFY